jgi:glycosyltransferase involved in cell wall biosynthesis
MMQRPLYQNVHSRAPPCSHAAIIRGDLGGRTGWGKAIRALASILQEYFDPVYAIDLYVRPAQLSARVDLPLVTDNDVAQIASAHKLVLFNFCLPHEAILPSGCLWVNYFFFESDIFPVELDWTVRLDLHDQIWVPSDWQREVVCKYLPGKSDRTFVVPWPQVVDGKQPRMPSNIPAAAALGTTPLAKITATDNHWHTLVRSWLAKLPIGRRLVLQSAQRMARQKVEVLNASVVSVEELFLRYEAVFLAIQTDTPRKGLPVLSAAWANHVQRANGRSCLLIKYMSINISKPTCDCHIEISATLNGAFRRVGASIDDDTHAYIVHNYLSDDALEAIIQRSRAVVTATYGEGFGGSVVDAVRLGIPVITPRHTALTNLLPADYPYIVNALPFRGLLKGNLPVYSPSSQWYVPDARQLASKLDQLVAHSSSSHDPWNEAAQRQLFSFCGLDRVTASVQSALNQLVKE